MKKTQKIMVIVAAVVLLLSIAAMVLREASVHKATKSPEEFYQEVQAAMDKTIPTYIPYGMTMEQDGVNYGKLEKVSYYSETCKRERNVNVLLPAGYNPLQKYPVMYVLHGYWGTEDSMSGDQSFKIQNILGNAIAQGEAEKMILVFPYIFASAERETLTGMNDESNAAYDNFINDLLNDLMPFIEDKYSVATGKDNTAITGFSMGGRESLYIGLSHPEMFGYVGAMCPAPGVDGLISAENMKFGDEKPYLLMISAGSNDTVVYSVPQSYHDIFVNNGVDHVWHYVPDGDHGGVTIRPHMYNFICWAFKA